MFNKLLSSLQTGSNVLILLAFLLCVATANSIAADSNAATDVRLVIDISGSMKKNDPHNLRVPAVRLLTNLMPTGTRAGIWTFGQYVNNLLPVKTVDTAWPTEASQAAGQINSLGAFTNIPDALIKAMDGWDGVATGPRHVILLTDGVVDISKDATENLKARQRVINDILPKLKAASAHVHTIALSRDADAELLGKIARETDALFEMVDSADALNKVFLRIFEQSAPRDTVPLKDNKFVIDNAIDEFTLLVFKSSDRAVKVLTPDNKSFVKEQSGEGWRWYSDARYELITVSKPMAGEWGLDADVDPDNRVMVVSKLSLSINELPRVVMPGEQLQFVATLLDDKKPVTKPEFLALVNAKATVQTDTTATLELKGDNAGRFDGQWLASEQAANATITIAVQSPTFVRSRQFAVQIAQGSISVTAINQTEKQSQFEVKWSTDVFDSGGLQLNAQLLHDDQSTPLALSQEQGKTVINVTHEVPGRYAVMVEAKGKSVSGRDIVLQTKSAEWHVEAPKPVPAPTEEKTDAKPEVQAPVKAEPVVPPSTEDDSGSLFWVLAAVVNVLLIVIGGGVWWLIKRKQKSATTDIEKALGD